MLDLAIQAMWLTFNIYFEARGEKDFAGLVAVGHVTMNRVHNRKKSVKEVVLQPYQFSWTNKSDAQKKVIDVLKKGDIDALERCMRAAYTCLAERVNGETFHGANYYFNPKYADPSWQHDYKFVAEVGNHKFYKG